MTFKNTFYALNAPDKYNLFHLLYSLQRGGAYCIWSEAKSH